MLDDVTIKGFRGLDGLHLEGVTRFNIIVGPNNSGKSSLLEALFLHCAPLNFDALLSISSIRTNGFEFNLYQILEQLKWLCTVSPEEFPVRKIETTGKFNGKERKTAIIVDASETDVREMTMSSAPTPFAGGETGIHRKNQGISIGKVKLSFQNDSMTEEKSEQIEFTTNSPLLLKPPPIKTDITAAIFTPFIHRQPGAGIQDYDRSVKQKYKTECLRLIQKIDPAIEDISMLLNASNRPELYVDHKKAGRLPLSAFGEGVRRIYLLALNLIPCKNGVFFIDEVEGAIHTNALKILCDWLAEAAIEYNVQLFMTTHSLEAIDAILGSKIAKDELSLFRMKSREQGFGCKKFSGEEMKDLRYELGQDVRW